MNTSGMQKEKERLRLAKESHAIKQMVMMAESYGFSDVLEILMRRYINVQRNLKGLAPDTCDHCGK